MRADKAELEREQQYLDDAKEIRENERHRLRDGPINAATPKDTVGVRNINEKALEEFRPPNEPAAFGRIECDEGRFYIGYQSILDADYEPVVVNWQTSLGGRFYEATHEVPAGVDAKRQYQFRPSTTELADFEETLFSDLATRVEDLERAGEIDDALLADLERSRDGQMRDIVQTIRAAQHEVIRADLDQFLLVQGGPGTGKTAVALHRISWLLFNHRDRLSASDIAVVGPSTTFVRYIRSVLPSLGDREVRQLALQELGPDVQTGLKEIDKVAYLKGEARMAKLIETGLANRITLPDDPVELNVGGRITRIPAEDVQQRMRRLRTLPYATGRRNLRDFFRDSARAEAPAIDAQVERLWPQLTAPAFLQDLLGSEARLLRAAGTLFTADEVLVLYRRSSDRLSNETWATSDIPLLDHANHLISGEVDRTFQHIVVDEVQDVSPMQLLSLARRSAAGSITILGDLAQSTGPWARDNWDDITSALQRDGVPRTVATLDVGYRVPRQAFEYAAQLLPSIAPGLPAPRVVRDGPLPETHQATDDIDRTARTVAEAQRFLAKGLMVGVIAPPSLIRALSQGFTDDGVRINDGRSEIGSGTNLLTPEESKGLEFDAVVVVEPAEIVNSHPRGGRLLYIALTRTTRHLSIVHVGSPLPTGPGVDAPQATTNGSADVDADLGATHGEPSSVSTLEPNPPEEADLESPATSPPRVVKLLASSLAEEIRGGVPQHLWNEVLQALRDEMTEPDEGAT